MEEFVGECVKFKLTDPKVIKRKLSEFLTEHPGMEIDPDDVIKAVIEAKDSAIAEKDSPLVQAVAAKDSAIAERNSLVQAVAEKDAVIQELALLQKALSGGIDTCYEVVFNNFEKKEFPWVAPFDVVIQTIWDELRQDESLPDTPPFRDEDSVGNPAFQLVLSKIFRRIRQRDDIKVLERCKFPNTPRLVPDIVCCNVTIAEPNWPDVFILGELKTHPGKEKEGISQTLKYLVKLFDAASEKSYSSRIAFFSDMNSILFLRFDPGKLLPYRSELSALFPAGWKQLTTFTSGFRELCYAFNLPSPFKRSVTIDGETIPVLQTIHEFDNHAVFLVDWKNQKIVTKVSVVPKVFSHANILQEMRKYYKLKEIPQVCGYFLSLVDCKVELGFALPFGKSLLNFVDELREAHTNTDQSVLEKCRPHLIRVLDALKSLQVSGWYHGDVRPANVILYGDPELAYLIDLVTAYPIKGFEFAIRMGFEYDPFHDEYHNPSLSDLRSFGLSILYLGCNDDERIMFACKRDRLNLLATVSASIDTLGPSLKLTGIRIMNLQKPILTFDQNLYEEILALLNG